MKLYVRANPYPVSYGSSLVFAVAENLPEARRVAQAGMAYSSGEFPNRENVSQNVRLGRPTRVLQLPCAEWHEWRE